MFTTKTIECCAKEAYKLDASTILLLSEVWPSIIFFFLWFNQIISIGYNYTLVAITSLLTSVVVNKVFMSLALPNSYLLLCSALWPLRVVNFIVDAYKLSKR